METSFDKSISLELEWVTATNGGRPLVDDHVFLIGRPPLRQYLSFVTDLAVDRSLVDDGSLAEEWRVAGAVVSRREVEEAGIADAPPITPLPERLEPLVKKLHADPIYSNGFDIVPSEVAMVELDRLVVYQKHINLDFTRQLRVKLGTDPTPEDLFRTCIPFDHPHPPVKWMRSNNNTFVFMSPSNDLRYLGTMPLKPENVVGVHHPGALVGVIGLGVGFGSNFLNAVHCEDRLVLNNGSHRAFAMREMGMTHAPCIIQHVGSREELKAVASSDLRRHPDLYLRHPRPSMLKDYFDPELRRVIACTRRLRQVRVKYFSDETDVPAV